MSKFHGRLIVVALGVVLSGVPAAGAAEFPAVVKQILDSRTEGPLTEMDAAQRSEMTACVIRTLEGLPDGKKRYIVEGVSLDDQQDRFGKVVYENRAQWQKKIAAECADIAMGE